MAVFKMINNSYFAHSLKIKYAPYVRSFFIVVIHSTHPFTNHEFDTFEAKLVNSDSVDGGMILCSCCK